MRDNRFYVERSDIKKKVATLSKEESHHLKTVLRMKKDEPVVLFTGDGEEFQGRVASLAKRVAVTVDKKGRTRLLAPYSIVLAQALPKKKKMDFVVAKACELGVEEIYPVQTERVELKIGADEKDRVVSRWKRVAVQACKQSRLDWIPEIHDPIKFADLFKKKKDVEAVLIPHPDATFPKLADFMADFRKRVPAAQEKRKKIILVIGPEGGFSDKEIEYAKSKGADFVHLGDLVLRTETASVVGTALVKYALSL